MKKVPGDWKGMSSEGDTPEVVEALIAELKALKGQPCKICRATLCGHQALFSVMMGFKDSPICTGCLAETFGWTRDVLRDQVHVMVKRRVCYTAGWKWASEAEGFDVEALPACLWPEGASAAPAVSSRKEAPSMTDPRHDVVWNAGDMGCGDLVMDLRFKLEAMKPGQILKITATDPGAPADMPSWCGLTGHTLVAARHPVYWIQKKEG